MTHKVYMGWSNSNFGIGYTVGTSTGGLPSLVHNATYPHYLQVIGKTLYGYDVTTRAFSKSTNLTTPSFTSFYTAPAGGNAFGNMAGSADGTKIGIVYSSDLILMLSTNSGASFAQVPALTTSAVQDFEITSTRLYVMRGTGTTSPSGFYAIDFSDLNTLKNNYYYRGWDALQTDVKTTTKTMSVIEGGGVGGKDLIYLIGSKASDGVTRCIHKSVDSGVTFTEISLPAGLNNKIHSVHALDINNVYVGSSGAFAFSSDQGSTWTAFSVGLTTYGLASIYAFSNTEVYVAQRLVTYSAGQQHYVYKINPTTQSVSIAMQTTSGGFIATDFLSLTGVRDNEIPYNVALSSSTVVENSAAGTVIGALSASDFESQAVTFAMQSGNGVNDADNSKFTIVGNNLQVASGAVLDYEAQTSCNILVKATDAGGAISYRTFAVSITNANDAPTNILLSSNSIAENNSINDVIGTLSAVDQDSSSFTFSIVPGFGDDKFNISGNQLRASVVFDYETATSHSVTIRVTDPTSLTYDKVFTINIIDGIDPLPIDALPHSVMNNGAVVVTIAADPTTNILTRGGQPLPNGSIVKNSITNQKFMKISGGSTSYTAIELSPKVEWSWSANGSIVWSILQDF